MISAQDQQLSAEKSFADQARSTGNITVPISIRDDN